MSRLSISMLLSVSILALASVAGPASAEEPKAIKIVAPEYPRGAERRKIEGFVVIQFAVQADGTTLNPTVVEAEPTGVFDAAAIKAVEDWKYEQSEGGLESVQKKLRFQLN